MHAAPRSGRGGVIYLHKHKRRHAVPGRLLLAVFLAGFLPLVLTGVVVAVIAYAGFRYYTATVHAANLPHLQPYAFQDARVYDRHGVLLYEVSDPMHGARRPVPLAAVPLALREATIAVEDKTFYTNPGFDPSGVLRAARDNLLVGHVVGGGSTITQQLVKNMLLDPAPTVPRKIHELILASALTRYYSKSDILRMYLNSVYYGARAYGVETAAEVYFHRHVQQLDLAQCALIAGLPQSPSRYSPLVHPALALARQQEVLQRMVAQGYISRVQARAARAEARHFTYTTPPAPPNLAPQFVQYVLELLEQSYGPALYTRGLRIYTTLDLGVQRHAQAQVAQQISLMAGPHNMHDGAAVVLDRAGGILAMVGAANPADSTPQGAGQVNMALWPMHPGSSFKLFTYLAAFEHGLAPASVIDDTPVVYTNPWGQAYVPNNYDLTFHGAITLRVALANSFNVPAVKLTNQLGVGTVLEMAHRLGITTLNDPPQSYGLPLTLGDGSVSLLQLTNAYATMARGGLWRPTTPILRVMDAQGNPVAPPQLPPARRAVSPQIAYLITSILSDNYARIREFGYNSVLQLPTTPAAAKTGTSQDWKDNVTVGYTPRYTTGVWVGNANAEAMYNIIGIDGAGPIWHAVMTALTLHQPAQPFLRPRGITLATVSGYSGLLAVPNSGWIITDVFAPNDLPHAYDNPYADQTNVPLWDGYSMNVHDGNWDYPATRRYALPVGGPLNAPAMSYAGSSTSGTAHNGNTYTVTQVGPGAHPPEPGMAYWYTYTPGSNGQVIYTYHYYWP